MSQEFRFILTGYKPRASQTLYDGAVIAPVDKYLNSVRIKGAEIRSVWRFEFRCLITGVITQ